MKRRREFAETFTNLRSRPGGESEGQCRIQLGFDKAGGKWRWPDANLGTGLHDQGQVGFASKPGDKMQPRIRYLENKVFPEQLVETFNKEFPTLRIKLSHALDVTKEISLRQKTGERRLVDRWGMLIHDRSNLNHR